MHRDKAPSPKDQRGNLFDKLCPRSTLSIASVFYIIMPDPSDIGSASLSLFRSSAPSVLCAGIRSAVNGERTRMDDALLNSNSRNTVAAAGVRVRSD